MEPADVTVASGHHVDPVHSHEGRERNLKIFTTGSQVNRLAYGMDIAVSLLVATDL